MNFRITQARQLLSLIFTIIFLLGITGCGSHPASKTGEAAIEPQPGEWMAEFPIELKNGKIENWEVYFDVSEDGKTVPTVQLVYYTGDWTPDTQA